MNILQVHNRYLQRGGEEYVVESERRLLERHGHKVACLEVDNRSLADAGPAQLWATAGVVWNMRLHRIVRRMIREHEVDVLHCHNIFPRITPSVYHAARAEGIGVVQSLHNFRLICLNGLLLRDGRSCLDCVGRLPSAGVVHRCYRGSLPASLAMAAALGVHRLLGTWRSQVDAFLLLSEHARAVFVRAGLPPAALIVKPNFVDPDPGMGSHDGTSAVFAGRLSSEKGVTFLLELWQSMGHDIPLRIYGDGPLRGAVEAAAARNGTVTYGGVVSQEDLRRALGSARVLLVPSVADGDVPTVMLQALAVGLPVVAGRTGALREAVRDGVFGMTVPVGDIDAWRGAIMQVLSSAAWRNLSRGAREEYMSRYSGEVAYPGLMTAYESVLGNTRRRRA